MSDPTQHAADIIEREIGSLLDSNGGRNDMEIERRLTRAAEKVLALAVRPDREGWQPIETAPKDGSKIMVCTSGRQDWVCIAAHTPTVKFKGGHPWREVHSLGRICWHEPTHWRPLPVPINHEQELKG